MGRSKNDLATLAEGRFLIDRIIGRTHLGSTITTLRRELSPVLDHPNLKESLALQLTRYAAREWVRARDVYSFVMRGPPGPSPDDIAAAMLGDRAVRQELLRTGGES